MLLAAVAIVVIGYMSWCAISWRNVLFTREGRRLFNVTH